MTLTFDAFERPGINADAVQKPQPVTPETKKDEIPPEPFLTSEDDEEDEEEDDDEEDEDEDEIE